MAELNLPADLVAFLRCGQQPEYDPTSCEAGAITLLPLDQLKVEFFPMTPDSPEDRHAGENGSYLVQGVSLVASCDGYDPVGLLLWLPVDGRYGLWDGEHGTLRVFGTHVTWSDIAGDLPRHLNAHWGLDDSVPVSDLAPWRHHAYNAEQVNHPLPDIAEWYEARWVRRGVFRNGVQVRFREEVRIRIECDGEHCEVTSQVKPPEPSATWSPAQTHRVPPQEWQQLQPWLDAGFWNRPSMGGNPAGETETLWSFSGFRTGRFHTLLRSYEEGSSPEDAVHDLGKRAARLAGIERLEAEN
jgi:hypothetical protein